MNNILLKNIAKELRSLADRIEAGNSNLTEEEAMALLSTCTHEVMSKDQAYSYLNLSRSRFDDLVREGKLPKGKKRRGFKELCFYKDELNAAMAKIKNGENKL